MPNGKPGDHPVNDILDHGLSVFSPEVDDLVRRVARFVPRYRLFEMFDWFNPPPLAEFKSRLEAEVERLIEDTRVRGWEAG